MKRTFSAWTRTIHIYLTMAGLGLMLFFAVTGFTVNHEDWFGATTPRMRNVAGVTPVEWVKGEGRVCEATISRLDGKTEVEIKTFGLAGRINDLHRGRDAGEGWRWVIDA